METVEKLGSLQRRVQLSASRRKVKSKIETALELSIEWRKIDSYKSLLETITHEEAKKEAEIDKDIAEKVKAILLTVKNSPDSKKPALLEKLGKFEVAIRTTELPATEIKSKKPATKKVA